MHHLAERPGSDPAGMLWSGAKCAPMLAASRARGGIMAKKRKAAKAGRRKPGKAGRKTVRRAAARKSARKPARKPPAKPKRKPQGIGARLIHAVDAVLGT